jgi:hypothetical protein
MNRVEILTWGLAGIMAIILVRVYFDSGFNHLKCIVSSVDGNQYCVRDREKVDKAADILAAAVVRLKEIVEHVHKKYPENDDVKRLVKNFNPKRIVETLPTSKYTAYSENKGEKMAFCLTKDKEDNEDLIDIDTLTFVGIHEIAHIMTKSIGHKDEFWNNFKFLLENAKDAGIYEPIDYKLKPREYCGMTISDNPYFDL